MVTSIVTGGAGFLGSHLVDALVKRGEAVVVLDNLTTGRLANLERAISSGRVAFVYTDVAADTASLRAVLTSSDVRGAATIYHLASPASPNACGARPWQTLAVNALGTMSLIEIALDYGARLVFASTCEVYEDPLVYAQPEDYFHNTDPMGPRSCYREAKRFGEAVVTAAVRNFGLDACIVRFFNCYGPRMQRGDGRLVPALLDAVLQRRPLPIQGNGQQTRSMTYVDDAIKLLLLVAASSQPTLAPVNVGSDDERSVLEIARSLCATLGVEYATEFTSGRPADPQRRRPDLTRARSYGWTPKVPLEQGLRATYDWFAQESSMFV